jgi:hypothetical protein
MQTGLYRKTVMKALSTKPAKLGLKLVAKSNARTNLALASVGMTTEIGLLLRSLTPYILGLQMTQSMTKEAMEPFGNIGYHLTILCRVLKISTPTASKKARLSGTRTAALMQLAGLSTDILKLFAENFEGPRMHEVERVIVLPKQGGKKELRVVRQVDTEADRKVEAERQTKLKHLVMAVVDIYWRLCFDIFKIPPAAIFEQNAAAVVKRMQVIKPKVLSAKSDVVFKGKDKPEVLTADLDTVIKKVSKKVSEKIGKTVSKGPAKLYKPIDKGPKK